jgi:hypothetical protein
MREFRRLLGVASIVVTLVCTGFTQGPVSSTGVETIPVQQIHPGMQGVAYTVFQGTQPEPMEFEVLGVLRNLNGPKANVILIRLHGQKVEYTGVVAGMSGSPAYIDGKLAGALAFRIGEFSKEPIAGITPIGEMLEINQLDRSPGSEGSTSKAAGPVTATAAPGSPADSLNNFATALKPIDTPLVFSGFTEDAIRLFAEANNRNHSCLARR